MKDIRCTHGCTHYHPNGDIDNRCDVHWWAWQIIDYDHCEHFDGTPYKIKHKKPKAIKQPKNAWQTGINTYQGFPYCCQSFRDNEFNHVQIGDDEDGEGPIIAFNCNYSQYPGQKITTMECRGASCPHCKLVGIEDYNKQIRNRFYIPHRRDTHSESTGGDSVVSFRGRTGSFLVATVLRTSDFNGVHKYSFSKYTP